jgi:hypothetical protein
MLQLAQYLGHDNCVLEELFLSNNVISDKGSQALAEAAQRHQRLHSIDLSNNFIGAAGVAAWAMPWAALRSINLTRNLPWSAAQVAAHTPQLAEVWGDALQTQHKSFTNILCTFFSLPFSLPWCVMAAVEEPVTAVGRRARHGVVAAGTVHAGRHGPPAGCHGRHARPRPQRVCTTAWGRKVQ